jgi:Amino acid:DNA transferase
MTIINIRAPNGGGKTTAVLALMARASATRPLLGVLGPRLPEAYALRFPNIEPEVFIIGPYNCSTAGCDRLRPYELIGPLVAKYAARGHVVFEGALVSSGWGVIGEALERYEKEAVVLFLDTSLETCLQRIEARSGKPRDARLIENVSGKYRAIERIEQRVRKDNIIRMGKVSDATAAATIMELLQRREAVIQSPTTLRTPAPDNASAAPNNPDDANVTNVVDFGRALFRTQDLDPTYLALPKAITDKDQLARCLVAYLCFYNVGLAAWLSEREGNEFWNALMVAAENKTPTPFGARWPRASERRHFRGAAAISAVDALQRRYARPEDMIAFVLDGPMDIRAVIARAQSHEGFGSWAAFKIADLCDAVLGAEVAQDDITAFLYDTPRKSIMENYEAGRLPFQATDKTVLEKAMRWLQQELSDCRIPHKAGRAPDWFSLETVWCKFHSHLTGHYPVGKDVREIRHGLEPWLNSSPTARRFLAAMPQAPMTPAGVMRERPAHSTNIRSLYTDASV